MRRDVVLGVCIERYMWREGYVVLGICVLGVCVERDMC